MNVRASVARRLCLHVAVALRLHVSHVEAWRAGQAARVRKGELSPTTVNGYLAILRVVMKAARWKYQLAHDALDGVENLGGGAERPRA